MLINSPYADAERGGDLACMEICGDQNQDIDLSTCQMHVTVRHLGHAQFQTTDTLVYRKQLHMLASARRKEQYFHGCIEAARSDRLTIVTVIRVVAKGPGNRGRVLRSL